MLHLLVGARCNNNCLFCMEHDREARAVSVGSQSPAQVCAMMAAHPDREQVLFTSGEPTLNPALPRYVARARREGFRQIALISNGRCLAYPKLAGALVRSGLTRVTVSIHGHTARLHDSLTRTPGSFEQSCAGLANLLALRQQQPRLEVHTATVINRRNLDQLEPLHRFLVQGDPELVVFNVMMPVGRGAQQLQRLMPRYADVATAFARLAAGLTPAQLWQIRLEDLPPCVGRLQPLLRGEPERFLQYEALGSSGHSEQAGAGDRAPAEAPRLAGFYLTSRQRKDRQLRVKQGPCLRCAARARCAGVYRCYAEALGTGELRPFGAHELAAAERLHPRPDKRRRSRRAGNRR